MDLFSESKISVNSTVDPETGAFVYTQPAVNYKLKFNPDNGEFTYVGSPKSPEFNVVV